MNEKVKQFLILTVYRTIVAAGAFAVLWALKLFLPRAVDKISVIWSNNTDFGRVIGLLSDLLKELIPF